MDATTSVFLEAWIADGFIVRVPGAGGDAFFGSDQRAQLASAAPASVLAVLLVEWCIAGLEGREQCPECGGFQPRNLTQPDRAYYLNRLDHQTPCAIDVALTQAGLPTQALRDDLRRVLVQRRRAQLASLRR